MKNSSTGKHTGSAGIDWDSHRHIQGIGNSSFQSCSPKTDFVFAFCLNHLHVVKSTLEQLCQITIKYSGSQGVIFFSTSQEGLVTYSDTPYFSPVLKNPSSFFTMEELS